MTPAPASPSIPWSVVVALPVPAYDFAPPHGWTADVPVGCRVLVPWRAELAVGLVVGAGEPRGAHRLREAVHVLDDPQHPWVQPGTVQGVLDWARDARIPAGLIWSDLLGTGWDTTYTHMVRAVEGADLSVFSRKTPGTHWADAAGFHPALLDAIREQGLLEERFTLKPRLKTVVQARELPEVPLAARTMTVLRARPWAEVNAELRQRSVVEGIDNIKQVQQLTVKQAQAHQWLLQSGPQDSLNAWASGAAVTLGVVKKVIEAGLAEIRSIERRPDAAWEWLRDVGMVENLTLWAQATQASAVHVTRILHSGGAEYVPLPAPPPAAWAWLHEQGPVDTLTAWANGTSASGIPLTPTAAGALLAKGWADSVAQPAPLPDLPAPLPLNPEPDLPDQLPEAAVWRLHGGRPTSRSRTLAPRVRRLLEQGRSVLVIAPEHATLRRAWEGLSGLAQPSGTRAVQVSGLLSEVQREHTWELIRSGEARLVIGSSHALVAPLDDLALLVVLEEGSDAHKLLSGSRAFLPDVAARIARSSEAALAFVGSTPAAESVPHVGAVLPPPRVRVHVVDYNHPPQQPELGPLSSVHLTPGDLGYPISHDLARVLRQVQERGRQAALLAPRRGYSALLRCPNCEHTPQCRNCDVPLRFHQETRQLTCHQCGYHEGVPERCDQCGERMWRARGPGTEWIAQEVEKLLPGMKVYRLDKDRQDDLSPLYAGESGVVVGTQLLLAQDAPPNLALIGVTLADTWLNVSDFRASERYHRLLRQLAEWHPSRAPMLVVQTFQGDHPALKVVVEGRDALAYPLAEERARVELGYPPHARLAQVEVTHREASKASAVAHDLASALHGAGASETEVLGPAPSPVARLRGVYPYHLLLRARSDTRLAELLKVLDRTWKARVRVDVNPRGSL